MTENHQIRVVEVQAFRKEHVASFEFFIIIEGPSGAFGLPIAPASLMNYERFKEFMLVHTGVMWTCPTAEGRPHEAAQEAWAFALVRLCKPMSPPAGTPITLNAGAPGN